ncbi:MAG: RidA family protein [Clostridiales bacterium]|nr:RidA family protein [Clostridiales bacterium]
MKVISTPNAPAAIGPYSQGIVSRGFVYVSGQLPIDPATGVMKTEIAEAARRSLENVKAIVEAAGSDMAHVVKTTCYLADLGDFAAFNAVYAEYFVTGCPARACFETSALPKGALCEVEAVAEIPE